jgi:hypothetical protein
MPNRAELLKQKFETSVGLPLAEVLPEEWLQQVLDDAGAGGRESILSLSRKSGHNLRIREKGECVHESQESTIIYSRTKSRRHQDSRAI